MTLQQKKMPDIFVFDIFSLINSIDRWIILFGLSLI